MKLSTFLDDVTNWAAKNPAVVGLALVGSRARGTARTDSDIDLLVLYTNPESLLEHRDWITEFGEIRNLGTEDYAAVRSLRAFYRNGLEVEFSIAAPSWAKVPLDAGTRRVLTDGIRVLYDPDAVLDKALHATAG